MWNIERTVRNGDYNFAVVKNHPSAKRFGYVYEHRVVMENHLGRLLCPDEIVHHINGDKRDNRIENLEVVSRREHSAHHSALRGRRMIVIKCPGCGNVFEKRKNLTHLSGEKHYTTCSRQCSGKFSQNLRLFGLTKEVKSLIDDSVIGDYIKFPSSLIG